MHILHTSSTHPSHTPHTHPTQAGMLATAGTVGAQLSSVLTAVQWDPSSTDRQYWQITAWVMVGVAAAGLLLTVLLAPKIKVENGCIVLLMG